MIHPHVQLVLPAGFDGPIVKPMKWREWNDSKTFTRAWLHFIQPIKFYRRARMVYRHAHWAREKNFMRKWWFDLSRYDRDCWTGRRADGEFENIMLAAGFKGPKYQRGNFAMFPAGTTASQGGLTLGLSSANNDAFNVDFNPPSPLDAGFGLFQDGTHDRVDSSGQNQINFAAGDWVVPRDSQVGQDFEVKWNITLGVPARINDESYTEDVWTRLNTTVGRGRYVGKSTSGPAIIDQFEIDIGDYLANSSDVNQNYAIEAGNLI